MNSLNLTIAAALLSLLCLIAPDSYAVSQYGPTCDDNPKCMDCRDSSGDCQKCMHDCWNHYGPADGNVYDKSKSKSEICRLRRAKWCNAQCWDPDPEDTPSTKPDCYRKRF